jgi:hypothetical protein
MTEKGRAQKKNHCLSKFFGINITTILIRPKIIHGLVPMENSPLLKIITLAAIYSSFVSGFKSIYQHIEHDYNKCHIIQ